MVGSQLIDLFQRRRRNDSSAIIEGVQALKHAVRFGAEFECIITCDIRMLTKLIAALAPDISNMVVSGSVEVDEEVFNRLSPQPPRTKVIAIAKRKKYTLSDVSLTKPIVFLENPKDLENIGAAIRVSAAADAAAVVISGTADVWAPAVLRGGAALHYAVPVMNSTLAEISHERPVVALDPTGENIENTTLRQNTVFVFGTERYGISKQVINRADTVVRLPMRKGVSSLNLATSVAATLYKM